MFQNIRIMATKEEIRQVKQRFGIIGDAPGLNRAIEVALLIAPTDVSVLVTGESGVGKENFPQIIHRNSSRKHGPYIAVNCGAIPEGTIDSELFGHKKGSFTDAVSERKGYFEVADGGTIFLDEVGELPLSTQARLLRVLESGEFLKVGSSQVQRTDIRVVAATNVDLLQAIRAGKFREDLYYRLNTVTVELPPLRKRGDDILLLFRKFASDFADKYRTPPIRLDEEAQHLLLTYDWPGNIRQLRNVVERMCVIVQDRVVSREVLREHLPANADVRHPALITTPNHSGANGYTPPFMDANATPPSLDIIYKMLFDLKSEVNALSHRIYTAMGNAPETSEPIVPSHGLESTLPNKYPTPYRPTPEPSTTASPVLGSSRVVHTQEVTSYNEYEELLNTDQVLSLDEMEKEYIKMVLKRNHGVRKKTADDLQISERTLYRKLKESEE